MSSRESIHHTCANGREKRTGGKLQIPSSKLQRNSRPQAPIIYLRAKHRAVPRVLVVWILELLWCLDFGAWCFCPSLCGLDVLEQAHLGHFPVAAHGFLVHAEQSGDRLVAQSDE